MPVAGAPALQSSAGTTAGGVPYPNLADPAVSQRFANQAVAGGNPYGPPPSLQQSTTAAQQLQAAPVAPEPQQPEFMTPAMQQYINQFRQSQSAQQQALNSSLVQALSGLGQRRDAAAKVAATLPGEFDKAYQEANTSQLQASRDASQGFAGPTIAGNANQPLISAANAQSRAAGKGAQPLLEAGITADYSKGATALANTDMANKAALSQAQQQFEGQLALAQAQFEQSQQQQQAAYAHDANMARLNSSLQTHQYEATHPNGVGGLTAYQAAQLQLSVDDQAKKAGWSSSQGEQQAETLAPNLYQYILTGKGTAAQGHGKAATDEIAQIRQQVMSDPDLRNWFGKHGALVKDSSGALTWTI